MPDCVFDSTSSLPLQEDKRLVELVGRYGNKWTLISQEIGGRTDNAVKNRYAALSKKFEKVLMAEGLERSNSVSSATQTR